MFQHVCLTCIQITVSASATYKTTIGNADTTVKTREMRVTVQCPPRSSTAVSLKYTKTEMDIPFTAQVATIYENNPSPAGRRQVEGIFRGVSVGNFEVVIEPAVAVKQIHSL